MKKKLIIIVSAIIIIGGGILLYFVLNNKNNENDNARFAKEYADSQVGEDNVFVYKNIDEIIKATFMCFNSLDVYSIYDIS